MPTVELRDVGPVAHLKLEIPDAGVVVLRGVNGIGKSITLEAVEAMVSGKGGAPVRDGADKAEVAGFGAVMRVGRRVSRSGELLVTGLEGRLSPADLVDPGIDDPEAADARRIKALVQLSGAQADPSLFYDLAGGKDELEALVPDLEETDDVLRMAAQVKRSIEGKTRLAEQRAEAARGKAKAHAEAANISAPLVETDSAILQAALEEAIQKHAALKGAHEQGLAASIDADAALKELMSRPAAPTVSQVKLLERNAAKAYEAAKEKVQKANQALVDAQLKEAEARGAWNKAVDSKRAAEREAQLVEAWNRTIEKATQAFPAVEDVAAASQAVTEARQAVEAGVLARHALEARQKAAEARHAVDALEAEARRLRDSAGAVDDVLSSLVAKLGIDLKVWASRLVLETKRGRTFFADLSHGERWKLVIDLCADVVGHSGLLVVPQEAFEGLDDSNRKLIAGHAKKRGVLILTAEASADEEITAEVYE